MYASVRVQCECLFACFYCKKILLLWLAVQSVRAETHSEGVNDSVARSSWEGFSVYNPSLLLFTLTAPLSTSVLSPNHKPLTMAQQPIRYETQPLYSVKTLFWCYGIIVNSLSIWTCVSLTLPCFVCHLSLPLKQCLDIV